MNKNPFEAILGIFNKLSLQQKILIGGAVAIAVVLVGLLVVFLNEPNYVPLYTNLQQEDASRIVEQLSSQKVPYRIEDSGKTIKVPQEKVYELRLSLAGKGILSSGTVGYELFDKSTMGMSEFMQKLNFKRALEGELTKTIMQQEGIDGARVHLTIPEKSVFKEDEKLPTASVVLKMKGNLRLAKENATAIINLVSSSVEGLQPGKVTLLDTRGRLLSKENSDDPLAISSTRQYEIKQSVENYLALKAQSILDNILGYGNSMIQVNAELNFDQVEKTMETFDPESQTVVSEQNVKTENNGKNLSDSTAQTSQNNTTNYEISKTVEKVIEGTGNIKKISVAAVINDVAKEVKKGDKTEIVYSPRSPELMTKIEDIVKKAVGVNEQRQDQFSIVNISFETKNAEDIPHEESSFFSNPEKWVNTLIILAAIGASMFLLKGLLKKIKNEKIVIGTYNPEELDLREVNYPVKGELPPQSSNFRLSTGRKNELLIAGDIEDEITDEAARKKVRQDKISNYVSKSPVEAAKLINAWLHEDEL